MKTQVGHDGPTVAMNLGDGTPARPRSERTTSRYKLPERRQRWLMQVERGELRLVESDQQLAELVRQGQVNSATAVYRVGSEPKTLGELPELARVLCDPPEPESFSEPSDGLRTSRTPPTAADSRGDPGDAVGRGKLDLPRRESAPLPDPRSRERAHLSEELAVLNHPLADDVELVDHVPVRRWPKRLALVVAVVAAAAGAYPLVAPRLPAWRALAMARIHRSASQLRMAAAPVVTAPPLPSAAAATTASPDSDETSNGAGR